jgi:4-carboxymuconolactone decarboxylase
VTRLPLLRTAELDDEQAALYAGITSGPRAQGPQHFALTHPDGSLTGPFNALLFAPVLGDALQQLGAAIRYRTGLSDRVRETAILIVAAHWDCGFERMAHEAVGRAAGLTDDELSVLARGELPGFSDPVENAAAGVVHAMARGDLDDAGWSEASRALDSATLVELSTLVGYYATLALQLRVFRVDDPEEDE